MTKCGSHDFSEYLGKSNANKEWTHDLKVSIGSIVKKN